MIKPLKVNVDKSKIKHKPKSTNVKLVISKLKTISNLGDWLINDVPFSWRPFFKLAEAELRFAAKQVEKDGISSHKSFLPNIYDILNWARLTPIFMIKAVILGQDPYHNYSKDNTPNAQGYCFGSERSNEVPGSLKNIYKEIHRTIEGFEIPKHPDIRPWAKQGVLLLNTALTVRSGLAESHVGYWKPFTLKLMEYIDEHCSNVVFLLWGKKAQQAASVISSSKHEKLETSHPSGKSAHYGFIGCDHFNKTNQYLYDHGIDIIDWQV